MDHILPEGTLIKVEFELRLPVDATEKQIDEWLPYAVCQNGGCSMNNPLVHHEADDWGRSLEWKDTGVTGRREEFDHVDNPDGSRSYKVRYHRERRAA